MELSFRSLFKDASGIEYCVLRNDGADCLCLQGGSELKGRIRSAYRSAALFFENSPDNFLKPLSLNESEGRVNALFSNVEAGRLERFLKVVSPEWQYTAGRRTGRALRLIQGEPLSEEHLKKAQDRQAAFMEKLADYVGNKPHFIDDAFAMEALSQRYDNFTLFKPVWRYGMLRHDKIYITSSGDIVLLPSSSGGPGDICEDFALLECESAGVYPLYCAGVVDGYFSGKIPSKFWLHFAMYSALYSLWRCARKARRDESLQKTMQQEYDRIRLDFANFKKPVPNWYSSAEVKAARETAVQKAL